jgi:dCTP deaminase
LEMMVHKPLRIYAGLEICQIFYHSIEGHIYKDYKGGKYQKNNDVQPSMIWKEFQ